MRVLILAICSVGSALAAMPLSDTSWSSMLAAEVSAGSPSPQALKSESAGTEASCMGNDLKLEGTITGPENAMEVISKMLGGATGKCGGCILDNGVDLRSRCIPVPATWEEDGADFPSYDLSLKAASTGRSTNLVKPGGLVAPSTNVTGVFVDRGDTGYGVGGVRVGSAAPTPAPTATPSEMPTAAPVTGVHVDVKGVSMPGEALPVPVDDVRKKPYLCGSTECTPPNATAAPVVVVVPTTAAPRTGSPFYHSAFPTALPSSAPTPTPTFVPGPFADGGGLHFVVTAVGKTGHAVGPPQPTIGTSAAGLPATVAAQQPILAQPADQSAGPEPLQAEPKPLQEQVRSAAAALRELRGEPVHTAPVGSAEERMFAAH